MQTLSKVAFVLIGTASTVTNSLGSSAPNPSQQKYKNRLGEDVLSLNITDAGTGRSKQREVSAGIQSYRQNNSCEFVTMLGDNFYGRGVGSVEDQQFQSKFEQPYSNLNIVFRPVLGNHDHLGNIQAQIDYSSRSQKWDMPSRYYKFVDDEAEFFAIDSDDFDDTQKQWLETPLSSSTSK